MTNVCVSSPRAAAPCFPHGAQKAAVQCVSTQLGQSRAETLAQISLYYALCSLGRPGAQKVSTVLLSKHTNTGHCPDLATILVKSGTLT